MAIHFTKMHGIGNDFMVIDGVNQKNSLSSELISQLSHRTRGVGFDQCLLIEPSLSLDIDFNYRIFNADGHEVGQCGNGARCLALFAKRYNLTTKNKLIVATKTTQMQLEILDEHTVKVDMGKPNFIPSEIPFIAPHQAAQYLLQLPGQKVNFHALSIGNPHAVLVVDDIHAAPVQSLGPQISNHSHFPQQVNVGFMQLVDKQHILLRVYERGSGETLACGSGAVAAAAIAHLYHQLAAKITVSLPGGNLVIEWPDRHQSIYLTGPAAFVYEGTVL